MTEFLRFDAVWDWLIARGLGESLGDWKSTKREGALLGYLPSRLTIDLDPGLVAGALGEAAHGGFVAFNLYTGTTASWNVVMDLRGRLYQVAPDARDAPASAVHACALKNSTRTRCSSRWRSTAMASRLRGTGAATRTRASAAT